MQSRRRFFCSRVELVQLARAFLYPSTGHAGNDGQRRTGGHSRPGCKLYHTPTPTAAPGCTEPRNRARVQGHRQAPKQATEPPTAAHRRKQSTAPVTIPPETPINAQQSRPGRGCYPYTTRRQNAPQRRTEPPTEGKPPGVQKRRGGQTHSRHSPGTAPRAKIRAIFYDFSSDFLPFFPALSRSASEFYSRKSIVGKSKVARRWKSERV